MIKKTNKRTAKAVCLFRIYGGDDLFLIGYEIYFQV